MSLPGSRPRWFGTDGIRAPFGEAPLDPSTVRAVGFHVGRKLLEDAGANAGANDGSPPRVILGGDTRDSTPTLVRWLALGLTAAGVRAADVGVVPTPAVAFLVRDTGAAAGIAVSASHNLHPDNGIKLIGGDGFKWSLEAEADLEARLADGGPFAEGTGPEDARGLVSRYLRALSTSIPGATEDTPPLAGLSLVLDPGHGAASVYVEPLFCDLGASVSLLHASPDGTNINRASGSTRPEALSRQVAHRGAHLGIAFDGDADRAILVDEGGQVRDGDAILYLWARSLLQEGRLEPPQVVATTMSNLGLARALEREGIDLVRCAVGDRWVVETLRERGLRLGGEQSGHIVDLELATTGDGLLTALQMAWRVSRAPERSLRALLHGFERFPQILINVPVASKPPLEDLNAVQRAARSVERKLGDQGRLVLRYSGTEALARVMIEGPEQTEIRLLAESLARAIQQEIGA